MERKERRVLLGAVGLLLLAAGAFAFAVIGGHVDVTRSAATDTWCGLEVVPEDRCSVYDRKRDYRYPADIERDIAAAAGHRVDPDGRISPPFPSPYVPGVTFGSIRETDIEHIVAAAEAHDSGLCAASAETRGGFAKDLRNLTLASPGVNQHLKSDRDAGEWLPEINLRWFAERVVAVKRRYGLSVDRAERDALQAVLGGCPQRRRPK